MSKHSADQLSTPTDNVIVFCIEALTVGGAEQMLVAMANQFSDRGWQVHMVCLTTAGELANQLAIGVTLHVLDKRPGIDWGLPRRLRRLLCRLAPQAVNSHLWTANLWTRIALLGTSIPTIVTEHSRDVWKSKLYRWIDRQLAHFTFRLVAVSADTASFYRDEIGLSESVITVINNGVNTQRYAAGSGAILRDEWAPDGEPIVGTVGRLVSAKNHLRLLDMAVRLKSRLPAVRIVIVGEGPERASVEAGIAERQLQNTVVLAGARSDIPDALAAFDVFVLSSDREGHPLTALEAHAAGTPVVLTNAGGSADAIAVGGDKRGGLLVEKDDLALADAVFSLLNDPQTRSDMAAFARQYALAHFDTEHMVDHYERLFEQTSAS